MGMFKSHGEGCTEEYHRKVQGEVIEWVKKGVEDNDVPFICPATELLLGGTVAAFMATKHNGWDYARKYVLAMVNIALRECQEKEKREAGSRLI